MMMSMNIVVMASVDRVATSKTWRVKRPLIMAAITVVSAPTTEASVRLVQPLMKGIIIAPKITTGRRPARKSTRRSPQEMAARSSALIRGVRLGFSQQRVTM